MHSPIPVAPPVTNATFPTNLGTKTNSHNYLKYENDDMKHKVSQKLGQKEKETLLNCSEGEIKSCRDSGFLQIASNDNLQ